MNHDLAALREEWGIEFLPGARMATDQELAAMRNADFAMDALPALSTFGNSGIPAMLTTIVNPKTVEILFSPNKAAEIYGEEKNGDFEDQTVMFPMIEHGGEVSNYGDWNNNGTVTANTNFPQRQISLYQTISQWGELQMARAARARINWADQINRASILALNKWQNLTYFNGVAGLQNYGALNDPNFSATLQPGPKAYGSAAHGPWITNGVVTATPNEILTDIQSLYYNLQTQLNGNLETDDELVLAMSNQTETAITATNSFNVNVTDLIKKNFPKIRIETAVQFATAAGQVVQMFRPEMQGERTAFCSFNVKMQAHPVIRDLSGWKQKKTQGTCGFVMRQPWAFTSMTGL